MWSQRSNIAEEIKKLIAEGVPVETINAVFSPRQKTAWTSEYGWLTAKELSVLDRTGIVPDPTEDETLRGYRLTSI